MKYINRKTKQLIIDTPVHKSTTKIIAKDGTIKENIKYIAHIPNEILIFLLEKFAPFDAGVSDVEYIDVMLNGNEKFYLSFYDHSKKDVVELQVTNEKIASDIGTSVTIKKQVKSNSYFFTVSKKVFDELKNDNDCDYCFRYCLSFDFDSFCFKNFIVDVMLV